MAGPDLVIAGAPKCGTSSLFRWLADHPAVCGSEPKEPFYLMDRGHPLLRSGNNYHNDGWRGYDAFFEHCSDKQVVRLEATTHYFYQKTARHALAALEKRLPQIVFLLRKPSERFYSSYRYTKNNKARLDPNVSFSELVEMVRAGEDVSERCTQPSAYVLARDLRYGRYVDYLTEWNEQFGRERLSILLLEEIKSDPRGPVRQICQAVGLDASYYDDHDFDRKNKTVRVRRPGVHRAAKQVAQWMADSWLKDAAKKFYQSVQTAEPPSERTDADRRALAWLDDYYAPYNEQLARRFELDLTAWKSASPETDAAETEQ